MNWPKKVAKIFFLKEFLPYNLIYGIFFVILQPKILCVYVYRCVRMRSAICKKVKRYYKRMSS